MSLFYKKWHAGILKSKYKWYVKHNKIQDLPRLVKTFGNKTITATNKNVSFLY